MPDRDAPPGLKGQRRREELREETRTAAGGVHQETAVEPGTIPRSVMSKPLSRPLVVDIPHQFTRQEAKSRIQNGIGQIRSQLAGFTTSIEDSWNGDQMDFRVAAVGQTVTGRIEVLDHSVRVEVHLPWVLSMLAQKIRGRIEQQATLLLEKK